jgi:hypothetical protein
LSFGVDPEGLPVGVTIEGAKVPDPSVVGPDERSLVEVPPAVPAALANPTMTPLLLMAMGVTTYSAGS